MNDDANLLPRFHLNALEALYEGVFVEEAEESVKLTLIKLRNRQKETTAMNAENKVRKKAKACNDEGQKRMTGYFQPL